MTGRIVPDDNHRLVEMFLFKLQQEGVCRIGVEAINARDMETISRERRDSREQVAVVEGLLAVNDGSLSDPRPASPEVRDEPIPHLVAEIELESFLPQRLQERSKTPFLNVS